MKLHRKIKHNENVCCAHDLGSYAQCQGRNQVRSKSCLSNNSKTTEANLTKLHRKIEHNEKMCRAQKIGSYAQRSRSQSGQRSNCALNCAAHKLLKQI